MPITLYYLPASPPVRAVLLTAKALNIDLELKLTNVITGDNKTPEYLKINPIHTVPTLDDNGFIVCDSHAINAYLVGKYGKDDSLYPKDLQARAIVDQRLHFDSGVFFARLRELLAQVLHSLPITEDKIKSIREAYGFLDKLIGDNEWVTGDKMTIADFSCVTTFSSVEYIISGWEEYPNLVAWFQRCKNQIQGYDELNQDGVNQLAAYVKPKIKL